MTIGPTLATLALALAAPAAQDPEPKLSAQDIKGLNGKAQKWFGAALEYDSAEGSRERQRALKALEKAKEAFEKDWEARTKKTDLLASMPDLHAIFRDAFPYARQSGLSGEVKSEKVKEGPPFSTRVTRKYREDTGWPTVILLPGYDEAKSSWVEPRDHYDATWKDAPTVDETLFVIPEVDDAIELDTPPDSSLPDAFVKEAARIGAVLSPAGQFQRQYNVDRDRLVLDCGKGASGFGLRLGGYFPSRFAGIVLRWPVANEMRYESLIGLPVLLVSSQETHDSCQAIAAELNKLAEGSCTVIEGKGQYPFSESTPEIAAWVGNVKRNAYPTKVVIAPNQDQFRRSYWVAIGTAEPLDSVKKEDRPYIEAVVDRAANKVTITTKSVSDFALLLNDALVDLDKEITFVVNGVAQTQKRDRSFAYMTDLMLSRFDPCQVFTAEFTTSVPN